MYKIGEISELVAAVREYPDYPIPGILFRDLNPLYKDKELFPKLIRALANKVREMGEFDLIAGVEARGFILAAALATELGCGFIPVRKKGKLPGKLRSVEYTLEYGKDVVEIQDDADHKTSRILIVDDVFATGGTMRAVQKLFHGYCDKLAIAVVMDIEISSIESLGVPYVVLFE